MNNEHATCVTTYTSCTQRLSHKTSTTQFRYTLKKFFFVGVGGEQEKNPAKHIFLFFTSKHGCFKIQMKYCILK